MFTLKGAALLDSYWPRVAQILADALARSGEYTAEFVYQKVRENEAQCWCAAARGRIIAACITAVRSDLNGKLCELWLCAGDEIELWLHFLYAHIEPWAKENGCERMRINGRAGWLRKLNGYSVKSLVLEKSLSNETLH